MPRSIPALLALLAAFVGCNDAPPRPRSVLLIVIDTLRADHLGAYGYARPTSPALDRWSAGGALFERAWATSPWTLPSFGSIYTGLVPSGHAAGKVLSGDSEPRFAHLDATVPSLGEILAEQGFATAAVANNPFLHPGFGLSRGFETWDYVFGNYLRHPRASQIVYYGMRWLEARDERPFLLMLHVFDPHLSYDAQGEARGRFTAGYEGTLELPLIGVGEANATWVPRKDADRAFVAAAYDEEILFVDAQLDRLFTALEEQGLLEDTLVVLTSDHGEELFDHEGFEHGHTMHEELLRVPLVIWGPGVKAGRYATPVSHVDILPTVLDALGLPALPGLAGRSLWPLVTGNAPPPERLLVAEGTLHGPDRKAAVRWPWKLILTEGEPSRLYDLAHDPAERVDLAAREPERAAQLATELMEKVRRAAVAERGAEPAEIDAATRRHLVELGYSR